MIGDNINRIRKEKNLTLSELAERAQISKSYLSNIERNLNDNPSIQILEKISKVLDVSLITLVGNINQNDDEYNQESVSQTLDELGIKKEELIAYKPVFEFVKWKNKQKEIDNVASNAIKKND
ncbi:helix-turn-helix domain-containing protein [Saliterribacillus persicus]|uniref:XRE family transcriptional regulator of biofilm formation n=1 Tax=Saliterribacillus persicus TaxID=930114 RepID=A0A368Y3J7_9BACI|nr:helix-turn-helix domain-containing protein [Saliterribacillus persicus]RCW74853.1 XRE family transcriptional regulator of biofilm formation [Saliterribacillus persicus]